jgi:hypothetical protein
MACCAVIKSEFRAAMSNVTELLAAEFELLKAEVIAKYETSGRASSGNWADSVVIQKLPNGFNLVADGYINGRGPGKPPPSEAIEAWIRQKGIATKIEKGMSIQTLAYLIARKIGREGWKPKPENQKLIDDLVTPQRIQQILDKVGAVHITDFTTQIINLFKPTA